MSDGAYFSVSALTVVLVVSGWSKLRAPYNFRRALGTFKMVPETAVPVLVVLVPAVELGLAALQWSPALQPGVSFVMTGMFVAFTLLLLHPLVTGQQADCGCFGAAAAEKVSWFSILRNVVLIGLALMGAAAGDGASRGALPAVLAGLGCGSLVLLLDQGIAVLSLTRPRSDRLRG